MTPGQARVALGTFLLVSAGVAVNALFLQSDAVSAGRVAMGRMAGAPSPAGWGAMLPEAAPARDSERSSREEQGLAFEHDHGMALSAEASERLLKRIVLGAVEPANVSHSIADRGASPRAAEVIRSVEQWLAALGYQPGHTDGRLGEETVKAIREFEVDKGLVPRGRISAELVGRLSEATTTKSSSR
jgi:hypothetical protein